MGIISEKEAMSTTEKLYIKTTPSQMVNIGHFAAAGVLALLLIAGMTVVQPMLSGLGLVFLVLPYVIWRYLVVACTVYEITNERIKHRHGVLNKTVNEIELYRVRDYQVQQPFWLRLVGCGNVVVISADRTTDALVLWAVKESEHISNTIRELVEASRRARGVRDLDVGPTNSFE